MQVRVSKKGGGGGGNIRGHTKQQSSLDLLQSTHKKRPLANKVNQVLLADEWGKR